MLYRKFLKRFIDLLVSAIALVVLSPLFAAVSLLVRVKIGSPVFFKQRRPGKDGKIFTIYKFRTMTDERDENGELLPDEVRLVKLGRILRATSLDEIPELINIFKGDMSFVGPRPLLEEYLPLYNETQKHRHDVRPGLTGLAQVNGRNTLSWEEKFNYDVQYVNELSILMDIKIIFSTIVNVLKRDGINNENAATMYKFTGGEKDE